MNKSEIPLLLEKYHQQAVTFWETIVNMGGCVSDTDAMLSLAEFLKDEFEKLGLSCSLIETGPDNPPILVGANYSEKTCQPVLFTGHYDTVFPFSSYSENRFHIDGNIARGFGVLDMKGGIAIIWLICKVLQALAADVPLKIVLAGDEESNRENCDTIRLLKEHTDNCLFAFNMETGCIDRSVCIGRKGVEEYVITTKGVSSHPGNFYERGRNAILEAAHKIVLMQALTADDFSYTINVGTIHAGTVSNIIPDLCTFKVDVRFLREKDRLYIKNELEKICALQFVEGTFTEIQSSGMLPPFETFKKEERLFDYLAAIAEKYHLPVPKKRYWEALQTLLTSVKPIPLFSAPWVLQGKTITVKQNMPKSPAWLNGLNFSYTPH